MIILRRSFSGFQNPYIVKCRGAGAQHCEGTGGEAQNCEANIIDEDFFSFQEIYKIEKYRQYRKRVGKYRNDIGKSRKSIGMI